MEVSELPVHDGEESNPTRRKRPNFLLKAEDFQKTKSPALSTPRPKPMSAMAALRDGVSTSVKINLILPTPIPTQDMRLPQMSQAIDNGSTGVPVSKKGSPTRKLSTITDESPMAPRSVKGSPTRKQSTTLGSPAIGGFSIAQVAYPFKNSTDGKIEQFVHTPTTPGSDPRQPKGPYMFSLEERKTQPASKLLVSTTSTKQFDLSRLTGLKYSQKSIDSTSGDSEKSINASLSTFQGTGHRELAKRHFVGSESQIRFNHLDSRSTEESLPVNKRIELLKKRRPSLMELVSSNMTPEGSVTKLQLGNEPLIRKISRSKMLPAPIKSIDSHSLRMFEW